MNRLDSTAAGVGDSGVAVAAGAAVAVGSGVAMGAGVSTGELSPPQAIATTASAEPANPTSDATRHFGVARRSPLACRELVNALDEARVRLERRPCEPEVVAVDDGQKRLPLQFAGGGLAEPRPC